MTSNTKIQYVKYTLVCVCVCVSGDIICVFKIKHKHSEQSIYICSFICGFLNFLLDNELTYNYI